MEMEIIMKGRKKITVLVSQGVMILTVVYLVVLCFLGGYLFGVKRYIANYDNQKIVGLNTNEMLYVVIFLAIFVFGIFIATSQHITKHIILFWNRVGLLVNPTIISKKGWFEVTSLKSLLIRTKEAMGLIEKIYCAGSFNDTLEYVFNTFSTFMPFDYIGVALISDDGRYIEALKGISIDSSINLHKKLAGQSFDINGTSLVKVIKEGNPRVINDIKKYFEGKTVSRYNKVVIEEGIRASITLPLYINGNVFGLIFFSSTKENVYRSIHINMLNILANTIAASFNKNIMINDILLSSTIALAKITESRDHDTGDHLNRIKIYSRLLTLQLSKERKFQEIITEEYIDDIEKFSPLHDIGKVAIPDHILLKPGKLTIEEFEIMKEHAAFGAKVLKEADDNVRRSGRSFFSMGIEISGGHHEKYDGSGYPYGRKGDEIPLSARIVALADVFDALTSKRIYKKAYSFAAAYDIIMNEREKHFDPDIVEVFAKNRSQFYDTYCRVYKSIKSSEKFGNERII